MTTPIPEAAVEAAREVVHTSECGCLSRVHSQDNWDWYDMTARAALTAARPHLEAEMLNGLVGNIPSDPAFAPDFDMGDYARGYQLRTREVNAILRNRAATIAERTQS